MDGIFVSVGSLQRFLAVQLAAMCLWLLEPTQTNMCHLIHASSMATEVFMLVNELLFQ